MRFIHRANYRVRRLSVIIGLSLATIAPAFTPMFAAAAQVTDRSVELSSSSASATNVSYTVNFTSVGTAGAFVVDFCSNTALIGQTCTAPGGFDATSAASTTSGFTSVTGSTSKVLVTGTIGASSNISVTLTGITNPSVAGPLYARIVTYANPTDAGGYTDTNLDATGPHVDQGGVAIAITSTVGVSGAVLESMTFCVSGDPITANCTVTGKAPSLKLGEAVGDTFALDATHVSTGSIYSQLSTNAASGAIVNLKSNATSCGGLLRIGAPGACNILPALKSDISAGQAKFGVKANATTDTGTNPNGVFQTVSGSGYNGSTYALNYVAGNATGVTSVYGDPFLDTNGAPANGKNMQLTFGASVSNDTPAGLYSADLSMIATGKF